MKIEVAARVIGHKLFQPDAKNAPSIEVAKVSLVLASMSKATTKATTATVHVDVDATNEAFALGRTLRLTFEDYQQELALVGKKAPLKVGEELFDPDTGERLELESTISFTGPDGEEITMSGRDFMRAADAIAGSAAGSNQNLKH